jgi:hypothetical protein
VLAAHAEESEDAPWQNEFNNPRVTRQWALTYEHPQHLWLLTDIRCIHPELILVTLKCIIAGESNRGSFLPYRRAGPSAST